MLKITRRTKRRLLVGVVLFGILLVAFFHQAVTLCCILTETPRTSFKLSSGMRIPIRQAFKQWDNIEDLNNSPQARRLAAILKQELPRGADRSLIDRHLAKHYRRGFSFREHTWLRVGKEGHYVSPSWEVVTITACKAESLSFDFHNPLEIHYISLDGKFDRTEIDMSGKGADPSRRIVIPAP